jgi:hypothetical protein
MEEEPVEKRKRRTKRRDALAATGPAVKRGKKGTTVKVRFICAW